MDGARDELLAGAALTEHQHGRIGRRHPIEDPEHVVHPRAARQESAEGLRAGRVGAERHVLAEQLGLLRGLAHDHVELLDLGRLGQIVVGAELHGLDRSRDLLKAREHNHLGRLGNPREVAQHLQAFLLGHPHVEHDDVVRRLSNALERGDTVLGTVHLVTAPPKLADDELPQVPLVVGHQDADLAAHSGSTTRKTLPLPTTELTSMRPP